MFAEGKGVVAEGKLQDKKFFIAERILAKHDENYMPPELKNIMKENAEYYWNFFITFKYFIYFFYYLPIVCLSKKNQRYDIQKYL